MNTLTEIERWFDTHCDGDWEHQNGIRISSLDNPGWAIDIDINGTDLDDKPHPMTKVERTDRDWIWSWIEDGKFRVRCGPRNLDEGLRTFLTWCES